VTISDLKGISPKFVIPFAGLTFAGLFVIQSRRPALCIAYVVVVFSFLWFAVWISRRKRRAGRGNATG
jgi:hypothetical protein